MTLLEFTWYLSLLLITGYYLVIFRVRQKKETTHWETPPGVSIVVCVKNDVHLIRDLLQSLTRQDYRLYEIIIVDDYSAPIEQKELEGMVDRLKDVSLFRSDRAPGKKHALTLGIEKARYSIILCTDADCIPAGPHWIKGMVSMTSGNEMVLGYAPYSQKPGRLNPLIRFETVMTGMQYLSWAMLGSPYMGVGRNILFSKEAFTESDPYRNSSDVPYGDDDLFVQAVRNHVSFKVSLHPETFVFSEPATSLGEWLSQKHRHLSAGRYYSLVSWLKPGIFGMGIIFHWLLLFPMLLFHVSPVMVISFFVGVLIRWFRYAAWTKKLGEGDTKWLYASHEMVYAVYLVLMGLTTIVSKKKTWN